MASDNNGQKCRRWFLQSAGALGAAGLAGCSGQEDSPEAGQNGSDNKSGDQAGQESEQLLDPVFSAAVWTNPTQAQYNPYNPKNYPGVGINILFDQLANYNPATREFIPILAKDWTWSGDKTFQLSINEGRYWHNGNKLVADDIFLRLKLDDHMYSSFGIWQYISGIEVTDDHSLTFNLTKKIQQKVFEELLLPTMVSTPPEHFSKWKQDFEDASTDKEVEEIQGNLLEEKIMNPIGNGPFKFESREGSQRLLFSKFDKYPTADTINWSKYELNYLAGGQKNYAAMKSGKTDGTTFGGPKNVFKEFPDYVVRSPLPSLRGIGFRFQLGHEVWRRRKARQAFAHIVNQQNGVKNTPGYKRPVKVVTGHDFGPNVNEWFSDILDKMNEYSYAEGNGEKGAQLLKEEGFSKQKGEWVKPNGEAFKPVITANLCCPEHTAQAKTAVGSLQQFGIEAQMEPIEATSAVDVVSKGDFEIYNGGIGAGGRAHPYFNYSKYFDDTDTRQSQSMPKEFEVPMPVGNPDGELQTVNVVEKVKELGQANSNEAEGLVQELGWVYNQALPNLPITQFINSGWMTKNHWEFPSVDKPVMQVYAPAYFLPKIGKLSAKTGAECKQDC